MSKRQAVSRTDCPDKRKARTITDYYHFKDRFASSSSTDDPLLDAHSDYDDSDELEDQNDDTVSPIPDP